MDARGAYTKAEALAIAQDRNVVATDEFLLASDPYLTRDAWCRARVQYSRRRLDALEPDTAVVLINHFPMLREPTRMLFYPEFSLWCGTEDTADWHTRYNVVCSVYGHLHIPRTTFYDGVRFEEVSLGYPREWQRRGLPDKLLRQILPAPEYGPDDLNEWGGHFKITPRCGRPPRRCAASPTAAAECADRAACAPTCGDEPQRRARDGASPRHTVDSRHLVAHATSIPGDVFAGGTTIDVRLPPRTTG